MKHDLIGSIAKPAAMLGIGSTRGRCEQGGHKGEEVGERFAGHTRRKCNSSANAILHVLDARRCEEFETGIPTVDVSIVEMKRLPPKLWRILTIGEADILIFDRPSLRIEKVSSSQPALVWSLRFYYRISVIWDDLRYLEAISRTRSIRAAAREIGVSVSTAYRRIGILETAVGASCIRKGNPVELTPVGMELAEVARQMSEGLTKVSGLVQRSAEVVEGSVGLTTVEAMMPVLANPLAKFSQEHPNAQLAIVLGEAGPSGSSSTWRPSDRLPPPERAQRAFHSGGRFSLKERGPSSASSVLVTRSRYISASSSASGIASSSGTLCS